MSARRIQRKRTKGWRMPEGAVYVGRGTKWGNPWRVHKAEQWDGVLLTQGNTRQYVYLDAAAAVALYRLWVTQVHVSDRPSNVGRLAWHELAGKDLACWCPLDQPCHADVLLELANGDPA